MHGKNTPSSKSSSWEGLKSKLLTAEHLEPGQASNGHGNAYGEMPRSFGRILKFMRRTIGLFGLAAVVAIGQHIFYSQVDSMDPNTYRIPQGWVTQIGTALATLFQMSIAASIGIVLNAAIWYRCQRTSTSVKAINSMFKISSDPMRFVANCKEFCIKAKIVLLLAVAIWASQLTLVLPPGSLTVVNAQQNSTAMNFVRSISSLDGDAGLYQLLVSYKYGTVESSITFGSPSSNLARLAMRVFTGGDIVYWPSPCGVNCSYTVIFDGPAYSCVDNPLLFEPTIPGPSALYSAAPLFMYLPSGFTSSNLNGQVAGGITFNRTQFVTNGTNEYYSLISTDCLSYAATYTVNISYQNNIPTITSTVDRNQELYSPIFAPENSTCIGENTTSPCIPQSNQTLQLANFYAIEQAVEGLVKGSLSWNTSQQEIGLAGTILIDSNILLWNFVDNPLQKGYLTDQTAHAMITYPTNFSKAVEDLLINTTISLMSWADNPPSGNNSLGYSWIPVVNASVYRSVPVFTSSYVTRYNFDASTLWKIYGTALGIGICCLAMGYYFFLKSAVPGATFSFADVLVTTRNPKLDDLCLASSYGGENILMAKVRLGTVKDSGNVGFGHECDIIPFTTRK